MAIKGNPVTEEGSSQAQLYTGIAAFRVVSVNPNQAQLQELGYKAETEPVYVQDKEGVRNTRIVFHIEATAPGGNKIKTNTAIFIKNKIREDIFINKIGKFGKDKTTLSGELRNPYDGEIELLNFIGDWANVSQKKGAEEELFLDTIQKIAATGDIYEIREVFKNNQDSIFKAFCLVSEGKYQRVFNRSFVRGWSSDYSYLHKTMAKNQEYIKEDTGGVDYALYVPAQFQLKPWNGQMAEVAQTANHTGNGAVTTGTTGTNPPAADAGDDQAPF